MYGEVIADMFQVYYYNKLQDNTLSDQHKTSQNRPEVSALPDHVQYVLVGGGTAAFSAARAIRTQHPSAAVIIVSGEDELPYMRPPLSKRTSRRRLEFEPAAFYCPPAELGPEGGVAVTRGWRGVRVISGGEGSAGGALLLSAEDGRTHTLTYDECLLATGGRARVHPALERARANGLSTPLRTARDSRLLEERLRDTPRKVSILGHDAGAIELALSLANTLKEGEVTLLCDAPHLMADMLPEYLGRELEGMLRRSRVHIHRNVSLLSADVDGVRRVTLALAGGERVQTEFVIEMLGAEPDEEVARASSLETHDRLGGVLVNAEMSVHSHLYAAGDAACFYSPLLGRVRLQSHDHAVQSGRLAGENMATSLLSRRPELRPAHAQNTRPRRYVRPPMIWAEMGPTIVEGVGILDPTLHTVAVWAPSDADEVDGNTSAEDRRGVVFYLREHRVVGVLLWNLLDRMPRARQVLEKGAFEDFADLAKLFHIEEE